MITAPASTDRPAPLEPQVFNTIVRLGLAEAEAVEFGHPAAGPLRDLVTAIAAGGSQPENLRLSAILTGRLR